MPGSQTFTGGDDRYSVTVPDTYDFSFLGGDDWLAVRAGTVAAWMGSGNDYAWLGGGGGTVYGQGGNDQFNIRSSGWIVNGGADDDLFRIFAGSGHQLVGATGNDRFDFFADSSGVHASAGDGDDLFVGHGNAVSGALFGGAGNDRFVGFGNPVGEVLVLRGGTGNDVYRLDSQIDVRVDERTGEGKDTVVVAGGLDYSLSANVENLIATAPVGSGTSALLVGNALNNVIRSEGGSDEILGGAGNDVIDAGAGHDTINGGDGDDRIFGGAGVDELIGGAGSDRFIFLSIDDSANAEVVDSVADFTIDDIIDLSAIDANVELAGFQHFEWVAEYDHSIGSFYVIYSDWNGYAAAYIVANVDSDPEAEMMIELRYDPYSGGTTVYLTDDNFIL